MHLLAFRPPRAAVLQSLALLTLAILSVVGWPQPVGAAELSVDEVVARAIAARGGADKLRAIQSLRTTAQMVLGSGGSPIAAEWAQLQKRGQKVRSEVTLQGMTEVSALSGGDAWTMSPFGGRRDPQRLSEEDKKGIVQDADLDGPLLDWRQKGHKVELLGTQDVAGASAIGLRVQLRDGDTLYIYLDPDYFLPVRQVHEQRKRGAERVTETDFGSYGRVGGVWMPFSLVSGHKGEPRSARIAVTSVEVNVAADDSLFVFPPAAVAVTRSIAAEPGAAKPEFAPPSVAGRAAAAFGAGTIAGLGARNIGSAAMSGRVSAVAARNEGGKTTVYVGAASGGVWRSLDGGTTFKPVFDDQPVQSIGAIAIDPSQPRTVWVATGEAWTRNSVSIGDGVYRSGDGGATWKHMGLPNSERVARIVVDPRASDTVWVCVPGKLWSDSPDRGLYRTTDGGKRWELVLAGGNLSTGCSSVALDPADSKHLLAGMWDFRRKGWTFRSGGDSPTAPSGSALMESRDGGQTWAARSGSGLPSAPWGRVEVSFAPSDPKVVYAFVESPSSALYRSGDGGATWQRRDDSQWMIWRPFYFARLIVDPKNPDHLWKPDLTLITSSDGGKTFSATGGAAHGDWHDLWVDPDNPQHLIGGDDGGLWVSRDGGNRWHKSHNLPISQFYHVAVDNRDPYQVYGGLQDNSSWVGQSDRPGGITNAAWENLYDGDGFWTVPDPFDPNVVYAESQGGFIGRIDLRTRANRDIQPKAKYKEKLRFNWNAPIHASPTRPGVIYLGAQFLFRSEDRGDSWQRISPDLTTNDPAKQKQEESGGVTVDNSSAEMHTTIYAIAESPLDPQQLWVGTDDGNLQLSRDGGQHWADLTAKVSGLPPHAWVSWIAASRYDKGAALVTFDRHTLGDMQPWVFATRDFGQTWQRLASPSDGVRGYAHVIAQDPVQPRLFYLGTEFGLWISLDEGRHWAPFRGRGFPSVAVRDLQVQVRESDLVIGTHGRGIWIVDDLTPLRALAAQDLSQDAILLPSRPVQQRLRGAGGWAEGDAAFVGENPARAAVINYYQARRHLFGPLKLEVVDAGGKVVEQLTPSLLPGLNRVPWSMRLPPPKVPRAAQLAWSATQGPLVLPGTYSVRLSKGEQVLTTPLEVGLDRRATYTLADRKAQLEAVARVHALFAKMTSLCQQLDAVRGALLAASKDPKLDKPMSETLQTLASRLDALRRQVVATKEGGAITGEERIREHADQLYAAILSHDGRPTPYQLERIDVLDKELGEVAGQLSAMVDGELPAVNQQLQHKGLPPIGAPH